MKYSFVIPIFGEARRAHYECFWANYWDWIHGPDTELILVEGVQDKKLYYDLWLGDNYRYVSYKMTAKYERSKPLNIGADVASGEYVIFHDVDIMLPQNFMKILRKHTRKRKAFANCSVSYKALDRETTNFVMANPKETGFGYCVAGVFDKAADMATNGGCGGSLTMKKTFWARVGGWAEDIVRWGGEDNELSIRIQHAMGEKFAKYPLPIDHLIHLYHKPASKKWHTRNKAFVEEAAGDPRRRIKRLKKRMGKWRKRGLGMVRRIRNRRKVRRGVPRQVRWIMEAARQEGLRGTFDCWVKQGNSFWGSQRFGPVFPRSLVEPALALPTVKRLEYNFIGKYREDRDWVCEFSERPDSYVFWRAGAGTRQGFLTFDEFYFGTLAASKFTLCPSGREPWTYRFFEAALCKSIPVVDKPNASMEGFYFLTREQLHVYSPQQAEHNFQRFLEWNTFMKVGGHDSGSDFCSS